MLTQLTIAMLLVPSQYDPPLPSLEVPAASAVRSGDTFSAQPAPAWPPPAGDAEPRSGGPSLAAPAEDGGAAIAAFDPPVTMRSAAEAETDRASIDQSAAASAIATASGDLSLTPVEPAAVERAVSLLKLCVTGECPRPLAGQATTLSDTLATTTQRSAATLAYWRLVDATAAYRYCVQETDSLLGLPLPAAEYQQAALAASQAVAKADEVQARLEALRAQQTLASLLPSGSAELPLPSDLPFVGLYETHFQSLQARGRVSAELAQIHAALPTQRELIQRQADAVLAASEALDGLRPAYEAGQATLPEMLASYRQLREQRRRFLRSVLDYNEAIGRYAFSVASSALPVSQVVGMLIDSPVESRQQRSVLTSRRDRSTVRQASNEEPVPAAQDGWSGR